jgi:hypothetical protein
MISSITSSKSPYKKYSDLDNINSKLILGKNAKNKNTNLQNGELSSHTEHIRVLYNSDSNKNINNSDANRERELESIRVAVRIRPFLKHMIKIDSNII